MDFGSSTPNLQGRATFWAGQSSVASGSLFQTQDVKDCINVCYEALWNEAKKADEGWGLTTDYVDSVADTVYYTLPTDFEGQIKTVEIDTDGVNLSTTTGSPTQLLPTTHDTQLINWRAGNLEEVRYWFFEFSQTDGKRLGIVAPPSTGGTKSIRLVFEEDLTHLSAGADIPLIPVTHHELIAIRAAMTLRASNEMPTDDLQFEYQQRYDDWLKFIDRPVADPNHQMSVAGRATQVFSTSTGFVRRF